MTNKPTKSPRVPPRWFVRMAWAVHRALYFITGGRFGLRRASGGRDGMLRLTTTGRRSGKQRSMIVSYVESGPNLVLVAMNGWAAPDPAWWLNLQPQPHAVVVLRDGTREVTARLATDDEGSVLLASVTPWHIDEYASDRPHRTPIVILEPR